MFRREGEVCERRGTCLPLLHECRVYSAWLLLKEKGLGCTLVRGEQNCCGQQIVDAPACSRLEKRLEPCPRPAITFSTTGHCFFRHQTRRQTSILSFIVSSLRSSCKCHVNHTIYLELSL